VLTYLLWFLLVVAAAAAWLMWGAFRRSQFDRRLQSARREFERGRSPLQAAFLAAASASGKPRGLAWKQCELGDALVLARDRANGEIVGLVPATISFEAIPGGGMEEVEAVGNLRAATAIFNHDGQAWATKGRAVFNLEPREVLERYRENLCPV
jgi:hypothetical protein